MRPGILAAASRQPDSQLIIEGIDKGRSRQSLAIRPVAGNQVRAGLHR
jgi:hypothetical protein